MYTILVKIESIERRRRNAGLMHLLLGFFLVFKSLSLYTGMETTVWRILPYLVVAAISFYYGFFRRRIDPSGRHHLGIRLLQAASFLIFGISLVASATALEYITMSLWAGLTLILLFTERKVFQDTYIAIDADGVRIPGSYKTHLISWDKLESVAVRHDFVTFFNRNNRFIQYQVMQTLTELEVAKMNAFCRERIEEQAPEAEDVQQESNTE